MCLWFTPIPLASSIHLSNFWQHHTLQTLPKKCHSGTRNPSGSLIGEPRIHWLIITIPISIAFLSLLIPHMLIWLGSRTILKTHRPSRPIFSSQFMKLTRKTQGFPRNGLLVDLRIGTVYLCIVLYLQWGTYERIEAT